MMIGEMMMMRVKGTVKPKGKMERKWRMTPA